MTPVVDIVVFAVGVLVLVCVAVVVAVVAVVVVDDEHIMVFTRFNFFTLAFYKHRSMFYVCQVVVVVVVVVVVGATSKAPLVVDDGAVVTDREKRDLSIQYSIVTRYYYVGTAGTVHPTAGNCWYFHNKYW